MTVSGRVLGLDGKPVAGAPVDVIGAVRAPETGADLESQPYTPLGRGISDSDGRFRIEAERASSWRFLQVCALAGPVTPGTAFGCVELDPDAEQNLAEIHLLPEQVLRGRLVDVRGQPAAGVEVGVYFVSRVRRPSDGVRFDSPTFGRGTMSPASTEGLSAWPKTVTTDGQGRFMLSGVGRGLHVTLSVHDPRFAQQRIDVETDDEPGSKEISAALQPATFIEGRVLGADTGAPIPGGPIVVRSSSGRGSGWFAAGFYADDRGRFKTNPYAGDHFRILAFPPKGQPYLAKEYELSWPKGSITKAMDLTLPRGVLIHGKVIESGSGTNRPVAGAKLQCFPKNRSGDVASGFETLVVTSDDGSFQVAVPPRPGYLMVLGPTPDYVPQQISGGRLYFGGQDGGSRNYAHGILLYDAKAGEVPRELTATLRPGKTLRGRVAGPAGEPVKDATILSRQQIDPMNLTWASADFSRAREGRFELHGFDPEIAAPVYFLDSEHQWGARVEVSGKQALEELSFRLQPCGQAKARFAGPDGKPIAKLGLGPYIQFLMTPGASTIYYGDRGELQADAAYLPSINHRLIWKDFTTHDDGRVTLTALIPGATYRISDWSTFNVQGKGYQIRKEFTVKPGETADLGDILVEKPES
jgi:hypothetical protein